jgi:Holliday junction DNA helicase RuvA
LIGWLSGKAVATDNDRLVLNVNGVGYEVFSTNSVLGRAMMEPDAAIELFVHTHVSDGRFELYGFPTGADRDAFRTLIGLNGVGPRSAMQVLSVFDVEELGHAIALEDYRSLTRVPGIGKKIAQRICLELAEKGIGAKTPQSASQGAGSQPRNPLRTDALLALKSLGFPAKTSLAAVDAILSGDEKPSSVEETVARSLKELTRNGKVKAS